jgi:hypothetical protein
MGQEHVPNSFAQFKALLKRFQLLVDSDDVIRPGETPSGTVWISILVRFEGSYLFVEPEQKTYRDIGKWRGGKKHTAPFGLVVKVILW